MALLDSLKYPASRKVGVVDLVGAIPKRHWTADVTYTNTYYTDVTGLTVAGVVQDGEAQALRVSIADVETHTGGYYYDAATERVYVYTPYSSTLVQVLAAFYIATHAKDFSTEAFARSSRLTGVPRIKLQIPSQFGGNSKSSNGSADVINHDGLFDDYPEINFDAGYVEFYVAVDVLR